MHRMIWGALAALSLFAVTAFAMLRTDASARAMAEPAPVMLAKSAHPVAVELFTSQGCSSCPPADRIQAQLAQDPRVVAITRPVTYWDQLGWKDTLALPANTDLQRAYAARHIPGAGVYTPQSVVQGMTGIIGGRGSVIRQAIASAVTAPEAAVRIDMSQQGARKIHLSGKTDAPALLSLIALKSGVDVRIGAGENGGHTIHYSNVLIDEHRIGKWSGGAAAFTLSPADLRVRGADRYALILRRGDAGPILFARYL